MESSKRKSSLEEHMQEDQAFQLDRRGVAEQVEQCILDLVNTGRLHPGDRLPSERRLAEMLGVSRGTVRHALKNLEKTDVLVIRPGSGAFVASGEDEAKVDALMASVARGRNTLREVMEVRSLLEPHIAEMAASKAEPADVAGLVRILQSQKRALEAGRTGRHEDSAFHAALVRLANNAVLTELVEGITHILEESRSPHLQSAMRKNASVKYHEMIVEAISKGDPEAARKAMINHMDHLMTLLFPATHTDMPPVASVKPS
ncbi:FadR/GntR family transcriptional regulator [Desulfovibrio inopinatus]|uniref:FadR/GntR family transcriptional regulator n=1 Tax=Desulfovibrio inopinatus TaxID=102109 RepID=UPI0004822899|nr:FadR/GntR family transcriptional regulator [Desulfovibrio inopinatus]